MAERVAVSHASRGLSLPRARTVLIVAGPAILIALSLWSYFSGGRYVSTDNAYVQSEMVMLSTDVSGIVSGVEVHDNEHVKAGQVLFRLEDAPYRFALNQATAELSSARSDVEALKAEWRAKGQQIKLAEVNLDFARRDWARRHDLFTQHVVAQSAMDQAQQAVDAAQRQVADAEQQAGMSLAHLSNDPNLADDKQPMVMNAAAKLEKAQWDLDHTVVHAPSDGIVTNVPNLQVGRYLPASTAAFSLIADGTAWIEANPKETQLTWVQPGQSAAVTVDTYPNVEWSCSVASLSPASGSQFALLPAQNTSGNWVKVVQRIPIRVACPAAPDKPVLRAGMSAVISIDTGHRRTLGDLLGSFGL